MKLFKKPNLIKLIKLFENFKAAESDKTNPKQIKHPSFIK